METTKLIEILSYTIPSLITGGVAYYLFNAYFNDQQNTRRWLLQKENQKDALPLRLQAFERMALFLERINPTKLLIRITPLSQDKNDYEKLGHCTNRTGIRPQPDATNLHDRRMLDNHRYG